MALKDVDAAQAKELFTRAYDHYTEATKALPGDEEKRLCKWPSNSDLIRSC